MVEAATIHIYGGSSNNPGQLLFKPNTIINETRFTPTFYTKVKLTLAVATRNYA